MNGTVKRPNNDYRRNVGKQDNKIYVYGNTVRQINAAPARRREQTREVQHQEQKIKCLRAQKPDQSTADYVTLRSFSDGSGSDYICCMYELYAVKIEKYNVSGRIDSESKQYQ